MGSGVLLAARLALAEFGLPQRLSPPAATLLPLCELTVAVALLFTPSARAAAVGALIAGGAPAGSGVGGLLVAVIVEPCAVILLVLAVRTEYRARPARVADKARAGASLTPEGDVVRPAQPGAPLVDLAAQRLGGFAGRLRLAARAAVEKDD